MKNRKFWLVIALFTLTVPGFILFSYWYLGIFSPMRLSAIGKTRLLVVGGRVTGDYNKTGAEVVRTGRLFTGMGLQCEPVLIYFDNAITTGKPYLRSAGGCLVAVKPAAQDEKLLKAEGREFFPISITSGFRLETYAQTAVGLRKIWTEIARLSEQGRTFEFPLVQRVHPDGTNEFLISGK